MEHVLENVVNIVAEIRPDLDQGDNMEIDMIPVAPEANVTPKEDSRKLKRAREMAEEKEKLKRLQVKLGKLNLFQVDVEKAMATSRSTTSVKDQLHSMGKMLDSDNRSIYVGNVDYHATEKQLEHHFLGCGAITRVTILCDKFTRHPKGFAYVEFAEKDSVMAAMTLDDSLFQGRQIKVQCKRTNHPGISTTNRAPPRGRFLGGARSAGNIRGRGFGSFQSSRGNGSRGSTRYVPY